MTTSNNSKEQRSLVRRFIINPKFQFHLISYFIGVALVSFLLQISSTYWYMNRLQGQLKFLGLDPDSQIIHFLEHQQDDLLLLQLAMGMLFLIIMILVGLFISNRIAGPLYKLMLFLRQGKSTHNLQFRKNDYFQELPDALNEYLKNERSSG